jgi:hypothetical protein
LQTVKERTHFPTQIEPPADGDTQADADALATLIAEFIQYAYGGSFAFVRSAKV